MPREVADQALSDIRKRLEAFSEYQFSTSGRREGTVERVHNGVLSTQSNLAKAGAMIAGSSLFLALVVFLASVITTK